MKYLIRYNKTKGQPGRGTMEHVWRVFEGDKAEKEYLFKHFVLNVNSASERTGEDWNISCHGVLSIDKATSTATINPCS